MTRMADRKAPASTSRQRHERSERVSSAASSRSTTARCELSAGQTSQRPGGARGCPRGVREAPAVRVARGSELPQAYLFKIASNIAIDRIRHHIGGDRLAQEAALLFDEVDQTASPERTFLAQDELRRISEAMKDLPEKCRQASRSMCFWSDL